MIIHIAFFFILSFVTSMFSIVNSANDSDITILIIIGALLFIVSICFYSYYNGLKKDNKYIKSLVIYGVLIGVITLIANLLDSPILYLFLVINALPLYSITHTFKSIINNNIIIIFSIEILIILVSYVLGKYRSNKIKS